MSETTDVPVAPPIPEPVIPEDKPKIDYSLAYVGKQFSYLVVFWESAQKIAKVAAPGATAAIEKLSGYTGTYGVTLHVNPPVFEAMLPVFFFGLLFMGHDLAKLKTGKSWL